MNIQTLIVLTGPTGVGKTALTLEIAQHYGIEIINADSRQIYKELPIGTAAPTKEQLNHVKHHFVACKRISEYYSA
ncbi:isopentenyl transferase family protein, partial [Prevotella aurantiaca]